MYTVNKFVELYYADSDDFIPENFQWFCDKYHIVSGECGPISSTILDLSCRYTGYRPKIQSICGQFYLFEDNSGKGYLVSHTEEPHEAIDGDLKAYGVRDIATEYNFSFHSPRAAMVVFECRTLDDLVEFIRAYLRRSTQPERFPPEKVEAWRKEMSEYMKARHRCMKKEIKDSLKRHGLA